MSYLKCLKRASILFVLFGFCFQGCKKQNFEKEQLSSSIIIESNRWFNILKPTLSGSVLESITAKFKSLQFDKSLIIENPNSLSKQFIIKINDEDNEWDEYLSFIKIGNSFTTFGIIKVSQYSTEVELRNLENFINEFRLEKNFKLSLFQLNKKHIITYEGLDNDGIKRIRIDKKNNLRLTSSFANTRGDDCTDWYMITTYTYPDGTQSQTETYVGTTCGNGDCGIGGPYNQNLECINPGEGGGSGGGDGVVGDPLCRQSFNFTSITPQGLGYATNLMGLNFNNGHNINTFNT